MDPVTLIVAAIATGAAAGLGDLGKQTVVDSYNGVRRMISDRYEVIEAEVVGVASEPEEPLRRQLLAKKLTQVGADEDAELVAAAQELLRLVVDQAPQASEIVGVQLNRVNAAGDIEVTDVAVQGGIGVQATDVATDGSMTIRGVRAVQEPPHHPQAPTVTGAFAAAQNALTANTSGTNVGRDFNISVGANSSGSNAGRVRAVATSVDPVPIGENLWAVKVHNGTNGPITDLTVDVYVVDEHGNRTTVECVPAKDRISLAAIFEELLSQTMPGALGAIRNQATMMPGLGMPYGALQGLPNYSGMLTPHIASAAAPQLAQAQAMMTDTFPAVLSANQDAPVIFLVSGEGKVQADLRFADEDGNLWFRPFSQLPRLVE
ncbi:hypothetical protein [Nocardia salmonicida]|uniref:hypothetical protein n=1 Tax=Nocardia salmonicida TaxID=53431 RepID=UPI0037ADE90F